MANGDNRDIFSRIARGDSEYTRQHKKDSRRGPFVAGYVIMSYIFQQIEKVPFFGPKVAHARRKKSSSE